MSKKVIAVDLDRCEGHGRCYLLAPELFEPGDDYGHASYIGGPLGPEDFERRRGLVEECPERALSWRDADE